MFGCVRVKGFIKFAAAAAAMTAAAVCAFFAGSADDNNDDIFLPVIMYHSIVDSEEKQSDFRISRDIVEEDLRYLRDNGYTAIFAQEAAEYVKNGTPLPEKPVMITADDGFYNNLCYLLPLLEKYDMKATVSVVGYYSEVLAKNDPHVPDYSYLTWEDMREMLGSGRIELGDHTYDMHSLDGRKGCGKLEYESDPEYEQKLYEDIGLNQTMIKLNTGISPVVFAYPFGEISKESIPVIKKLGFCCALSCCEKPNRINHDEDCLFCLGRYNREPWESTWEFMERCLKER